MLRAGSSLKGGLWTLLLRTQDPTGSGNGREKPQISLFASLRSHRNVGKYRTLSLLVRGKMSWVILGYI